MRPTYSPLDYLSAFAIAFATGAISALGLAKYIHALKSKACHDSNQLPPL